MLKKIIQEQEISDQINLLNALKKEGIETTQATISRDFKVLIPEPSQRGFEG